MAKTKRKPGQVAKLRARVAELQNDLATARRSFLDYVRHAARQQPQPGRDVPGYSPELTETLRQHIERVGDDDAWHNFRRLRDASAVDDLGANLLTLHFQDAWCASLADEIRNELQERGAN